MNDELLSFAHSPLTIHHSPSGCNITRVIPIE